VQPRSYVPDLCTPWKRCKWFGYPISAYSAFPGTLDKFELDSCRHIDAKFSRLS